MNMETIEAVSDTVCKSYRCASPRILTSLRRQEPSLVLGGDIV